MVCWLNIESLFCFVEHLPWDNGFLRKMTRLSLAYKVALNNGPDKAVFVRRVLNYAVQICSLVTGLDVSGTVQC